jgi:hypothetical protein
MDGTGVPLVVVAVLALVGGLVVGAALAARRKQAGPEPVTVDANAASLAALAEAASASARLEGLVQSQSAEVRRLADAARARDGAEAQLWNEMSAARQAIEQLRLLEERRRERDAESWKVVQRLATVLAGGSAKGRAGENVLREHLAGLPPGMLVTDLRVNGKVVEYGLTLPDGRRLPVDSKWSAVRELEALEAAEDPLQRDACARDVEKCVVARAREVAAYLDPSLTAPVAVAAIPDAAYQVLRRAHADAFAKGVVVVPYSCALPVLLFLYSLVARYGTAGDVQGCLSELGGLLDTIEGVLENKMARAATMLSNGTDELRSHLGKARGSIARARASGVEPGAPIGRSDDPALPFDQDEAELATADDFPAVEVVR